MQSRYRRHGDSSHQLWIAESIAQLGWWGPDAREVLSRTKKPIGSLRGWVAPKDFFFSFCWFPSLCNWDWWRWDDNVFFPISSFRHHARSFRFVDLIDSFFNTERKPRPDDNVFTKFTAPSGILDPLSKFHLPKSNKLTPPFPSGVVALSVVRGLRGSTSGQSQSHRQIELRPGPSAMPPASTPSTTSSSSGSTLVAEWHEYVLRRKYRDPQKLKECLDSSFGQGEYEVTIKRDRWVLSVPRPMQPGELEQIEEEIYNHY